MVRGDMSVTEFVMLCWNNKGKILVAIAALILVPPMFDEWSQKRAADRLAAEREEVNTSASLAGMTLVSAWRACVKIGINDVDRCSTYEGKLLQEVGAPQLAKLAVEQRNGYYSTCRKFYAPEYCDRLLTRSVSLSAASKEASN